MDTTAPIQELVNASYRNMQLGTIEEIINLTVTHEVVDTPRAIWNVDKVQQEGLQYLSEYSRIVHNQLLPRKRTTDVQPGP